MSLSARDRDRLADVVRLQPTKNGELQKRWEMESGSEVHHYLESTLGEYYYRDENSLIRATEEAQELVDVEPGVEGESGGDMVIRVPDLEGKVLEVLPEPDERSMSVVATLHALQDQFDIDPDVDDVRDALQHLRRKGAVQVEYRMVPTYALASPRDRITVEATASA